MKTALSISFIAIVVIVMVLGFYETAYAGPSCTDICQNNGICAPDPIKKCNFMAYCMGQWHDYGEINCDFFFYDYCCEYGCPC